MRGGGNFLSLIYRLFIGFDDGVLWFIKVLFILYFTFAVYSYVKKRFNQLYANVSINLMTIAVVAIVWCVFPIYCTISVPMFVLGIMTSNCVDTSLSLRKLILSVLGWGTLVCVYLLVYETKALCLHAVINYMFIAVAILVLYKIPIVIKAKPKLLFATISFDLYLVHGKVLNILKCTMDNITLVDFIAYTFVFVLAFYMLRVKLKI